jgi:hypothetical protein
MAKLPPIEIKAIWARQELNMGKAHRDKALAFLREAGDGPIAQELRTITARKGRQPFGSSHLWWEIGIRKEELLADGVGYYAGCKQLGVEFMLEARQIETALAKYNRACEEIMLISQDINEG